MNSLVSLANPIEAELSQLLRSCILSRTDPSADGTWRPFGLPESHKQEAWRALRDTQVQCKSVEPEQVRAWLIPIMGAVQGSLTEQEFSSKLMGIWIAVQGFPVACFTSKTLQSGLRKWRWFPSPAEVCELLEPIRSELEKRLNALESLLRSSSHSSDAPPKRELTERERMTQEERDAVVDAFHMRFKEAVAAARSPTEQIDAVTPPEPRYFTTEQLAEAYRREGLRNPRAK